MKDQLKKIRYRLFQIKERLMLSQTDVVLASYPKTGGTWLQLLINTLLIEHFDLKNSKIKHVFVNSLWKRHSLPRELPRIYATHAIPTFNEAPHQTMKVENKQFKRQRLILLTRDPKDTLVSLYFHNRFRTVPPVYTGEVNAMVDDDMYGILKYIKYYQAWYAYIQDAASPLLLIRYEDLHANTAEVLRKIGHFIGLKELSDESIERAVCFCSFENMKKAEIENAIELPGLNRSKNPQPEAFKVREGLVGGYKMHLNEESISYINSCTNEQLPTIYGYPI